MADYRIKEVIQDGEPHRRLKCPNCGTWLVLSDDQLHGRAPIQCTGTPQIEGVNSGPDDVLDCSFTLQEDLSQIAPEAA